MPVSKHYKKGQTARQWRKNRNKRKAQAAVERKSGMRRAMLQMMNQQMINEAEQNKEDKQ
tara:strand:+ start:273 stop:452 length:180 start_codon:yes stop_codon:yes gene_type:complete